MKYSVVPGLAVTFSVTFAFCFGVDERHVTRPVNVRGSVGPLSVVDEPELRRLVRLRVGPELLRDFQADAASRITGSNLLGRSRPLALGDHAERVGPVGSGQVDDANRPPRLDPIDVVLPASPILDIAIDPELDRGHGVDRGVLGRASRGHRRGTSSNYHSCGGKTDQQLTLQHGIPQSGSPIDFSPEPFRRSQSTADLAPPSKRVVRSPTFCLARLFVD